MRFRLTALVVGDARPSDAPRIEWRPHAYPHQSPPLRVGVVTAVADLALPPTRLLIDGKWADALSGK